MDEWMSMWMDGWMDRWMDGRMDGSIFDFISVFKTNIILYRYLAFI